ncbi:MAG TPA: hypothetical protein DDZ80_07720 [Cyanobacteria bacterium UBA8803]|nr:hypothetical protein [Cyanobacteria bacterium UBA9273]HBL58396.1 hypothetical protein [Cyanobacteria bacterium UBA8803]
MAEADIPRLQADLEQQVRERTEQLVAANQQLERQIAEHQLLEEKLHTSEAQMRALLEAMTDIVLIIDVQENTIQVAPTNLNLLDKPVAHLINQTVEQFVEGDRAEIFFSQIQRALAARQTVHFEYSLNVEEEGGENFMPRFPAATLRLQHPLSPNSISNQQEIWFTASISPISEHSAIWVARDITDHKRVEAALQKARDELEMRVAERTADLSKVNKLLRQEICDRQQAEAALSQSAERFRVALSNLPIIVFNQDIELRYTWSYNSALWFKDREVIGKLDAELLPVEDEQELTTIKRQVLMSKVGTRVEVCLTFSGEVRYYDVTVEPLRNATEEVEGITCVAIDITDRKQAEETRQEAYNKGILLQEIHHRVKNNLQIVSGLLYLQSRSVDDERMLQMLQQSRDRLHAMALIHEQLYGSKNLDSIDFRNYIQTLTKSLFTSYGTNTKAIALQVNVKPILLDIDTAIPCGLIVNELVSNALKHAFPQGRSGEIIVEFYMAEDNNLKLMVRDNGIGLSEGINLQTHNSLGLRLVRSLATKQLKGMVEVDRTMGTTFSISFNKIGNW